MIKARTRNRERWTLPPLLFCFILLFAGCSNTGEQEPIPLEELLGVVKQLAAYDPGKREEAMRKIRVHPREPTVAALREILQQRLEGFDLRVRVHIAAFIATWEDDAGNVDKTGLPDLVEALRSSNGYLRTIAREVLPLLGGVVVPPVKDVLISGGQKESRMAACEILGRLVREKQNPEAARALQDMLLEEKDHDVRMFILINYAKWENKAVVEGLIDALTDPNEDIRGYAWQELERRKTVVRDMPQVEFHPLDPLAKRSEIVRRLRSWWEDEKRR